MIPLRRVIARGVSLNGVDWEIGVVCVEGLVLQLISDAGSEPQLPTRTGSRACRFVLAVLSTDHGSGGRPHLATLASPATTFGGRYGVHFQSCCRELGGKDREAFVHTVRALSPGYCRF